MTPTPTSTTDLAGGWRARADSLERYAPAVAVAFRECAAELDAQLVAERNELLSLQEAALASGLSVDHLRHQVARGEIPNAGRKGKPLVRRGDLPRRTAPRAGGDYDPAADALRLHRSTAP